jgi:hypothetical protein
MVDGVPADGIEINNRGLRHLKFQFLVPTSSLAAVNLLLAMKFLPIRHKLPEQGKEQETIILP